jgi:Cytochrome c3
MRKRCLPIMLLVVTIGLVAATAKLIKASNRPDAGCSTDDLLPVEKTNCVRCHLTAGRELTVPVHDFARSVHDRAKMSCNDCHGGNTDEDSTAHEHEFGFIGTKLSAHMAACAECHTDEEEVFRKGAHFWDLAKRINRDYPVCIDCHGNHDVGKPPADFSLANVCSDCHKNLDTAYPEAASIVAENDRLWQTLRKVHAENGAASDPTPTQFRSELGRIRHATAKLIHSPAAVQKRQAETLNARVRRLRDDLDMWLKR